MNFERIAFLEAELVKLLPSNRHDNIISSELLKAGNDWAAAVWDTVSSEDLPAGDAMSTRNTPPLCEHPVFILGTQRSGMTLLRDLLDGHPMLAVLPAESAFLQTTEPLLRRYPRPDHERLMGIQWIRRMATPMNYAPFWLFGKGSGASSPYLQFARKFRLFWAQIASDPQLRFGPLLAVVMAYAEQIGEIGKKKYWVDKTPMNEKYLKDLRKDFPAAKFIHVLRNPLDMVRSRKKKEPGGNTKQFLADLRSSFRTAARERDKSDYLVVTYEELCVDPQRVMKEIAAFLDIPFMPSLLAPSICSLPSSPSSSFRSEGQPGKTVGGTASMKSFSSKERKWLSSYLGDTPGKFGYPMPWRSLFTRLFGGLFGGK